MRYRTIYTYKFYKRRGIPVESAGGVQQKEWPDGCCDTCQTLSWRAHLLHSEDWTFSAGLSSEGNA